MHWASALPAPLYRAAGQLLNNRVVVSHQSLQDVAKADCNIAHVRREVQLAQGPLAPAALAPTSARSRGYKAQVRMGMQGLHDQRAAREGLHVVRTERRQGEHACLLTCEVGQ